MIAWKLLNDTISGTLLLLMRVFDCMESIEAVKASDVWLRSSDVSLSPLFGVSLVSVVSNPSHVSHCLSHWGECRLMSLIYPLHDQNEPDLSNDKSHRNTTVNIQKQQILPLKPLAKKSLSITNSDAKQTDISFLWIWTPTEDKLFDTSVLISPNIGSKSCPKTIKTITNIRNLINQSKGKVIELIWINRFYNVMKDVIQCCKYLFILIILFIILKALLMYWKLNHFQIMNSC